MLLRVSLQIRTMDVLINWICNKNIIGFESILCFVILLPLYTGYDCINMFCNYLLKNGIRFANKKKVRENQIHNFWNIVNQNYHFTVLINAEIFQDVIYHASLSLIAIFTNCRDHFYVLQIITRWYKRHHF